MKLKELKKTVNVSWSPAEQVPLMLAAGSAAQQVDASFSSSASLELYSLNLEEPSLDLKLKGGIPTQHKFQKLVWSGAGVIVGGCDEGLLQFYSADKLLHSASDSLIGSCSKHTGAVSALDINPYQKNLLASGASESEIFIWDLNNTSQPMAPGNRHQPYEHVQGVAWNQQVQHILGSTFATSCLVWDLRKNEPIMKLSDSQFRTKWRALAWHPSVATQLCVASEDDQAPVVQLWDLRLAASPVVTMEGHQKGVLSLSWSQQDPDLLLSTGKDGRLLCWNPNNTQPGGELVVELESGARLASAAEWAGRGCGLLAVAADTVSLHHLLGAAPVRESASAASSFLESFGGAAELQALPAVAPPAPSARRPMPTRAPRWMRRPNRARFAFGGKLVSLGAQEPGAQKLVYVSQVVTEPEVVERAAELDTVLRLTSSREPHAALALADYCRQRGDEAAEQNERYLWFFLRANFLPTFRTEILNLLGFKQDDIPQKLKGQTGAPPDPTGLSRGESTETEAELSTDTSTDLSDAQTQFERKLASLELEPGANNVLIPSGEDSTSLICRALVCGNLEEAVELCLDANNVADALIIASMGSDELLQKVQRYHLAVTAGSPVSLLCAGLRGQWARLAQASAPDCWRSALAALVTHCDADSLAHYCEILAERLRAAGQESAAALCAAAAADGAAAAAVSAERRAPLALLLRAAAAVRSRTLTSDSAVERVLTQYSATLAAQGCLHSALAALHDVPCALRDRLQRALGQHDQRNKQPQQQQQPVYQFGRARTVSGHSQRGQYAPSDAPSYNNVSSERAWPSVNPPQMPQPPRPGSVGNNAGTGGISSRSKYKLDPSVQSAPLYNQYSFNQQAQPSLGYNSPLPEQYNASVPAQNFTPISHAPMNPMNPAMNPMNPAMNPMNPAMNSMNPALNPMNPAPINQMNPAINGSYNQAPVKPVPIAPPPQKPAQPGWNDPPMMTSKPTPKQEVQQQAPITHPLFGAEPPQHVPLVPNQYPGQFPGQDPYGPPPAQPGQYPGQMGQYPGQTTQYPGQTGQYPGQTGQYPGQTAQYPGQTGQYPGQTGQVSVQSYQDQAQYPPAAQGGYQQQVEPAVSAAPIEKPPLPAQYEPLQQTFDALLLQCQQHASNPQMKRKLEDVHKRLDAMYDLLREHKLSEAAVATLEACAGAARAGDGAGALHAAASLAGGVDFAAVASFLPGLKVLLTAAQPAR